MKKNKKIFVYLLMIVAIVFSINSVRAEEIDPFDPDHIGGKISSCPSGATYCYNMVGLRASLYKVENNHATKIGTSHDYWNNKPGQNYPNDTFLDPDNSFFASLNKDDINLKVSNRSATKSNFSVSGTNYLNDKKYVSYVNFDFKGKVTYSNIDYRKENISSKTIKNWINDNSNPIKKTFDSYNKLVDTFNVSSSQLNDIYNNSGKYYIVLETLGGVYNSVQKKEYVGTGYDLSYFYDYLNSIGKHYITSLYQSKNVGDFVKSGGILKPVSDTSEIMNLSSSNYAVAMMVSKLNKFIVEKTCKNVCGPSPSLACAENYCEKQKNVKDFKATDVGNINKRKCMTSTDNGGCGLNPPENPCGAPSTNPSKKTSDCSEKIKGNKTICTEERKYLYVTCTEETSVLYSDDLPVILYPGLDGFNYSISARGKKTCKKVFDKAGWEFDYAAITRANRSGSGMLEWIEKFNKYDLSQHNYKWDEAKDNVSFGLNPSANDKKLSVNGKTSDDVEKTTKKVKINEYKNNSGKYVVGKVYEKTKDSYGEYTFELPKVCYSLKTGEAKNALNPLLTESCEHQSVKNHDYYGFYSKSDKEKVPTYAKVIKESSAVDNNNTCYYANRNYELSCKVEITGGSTKTINRVKYHSGTITLNYKAYNRYGLDNVEYCLDCDIPSSTLPSPKKVSLDSSKSQDYFFKSYIKDSEGNIVYCNQTIKVQNGNCKTQSFKPTDIDKVRDYCNAKWYSDGYDSFHDCFMDCGKNDTCKTLYNPSDIDGIKGYCNSNYASDGYDSKEACINDCAFVPGNYYFRTITLEDPFPNKVINGMNEERKVGKNWLGYENTINNGTDTYLNSKPEYVIVADEDTVQRIKNENEMYGYSYGKAAYEYDGKPYIDGKYQSSFIDKYFDCINGSYKRGSGCN